MRLNRTYTNKGVTINIPQLKNRLTMPIEMFGAELPMFGEVEEIVGEKYTDTLDSRYYFRDNHSKVLAVAHLDTVLWLEEAVSMSYNKIPMVMSPQLDDRMGVYILLDVLPSLGIKPDILLTVGEESCASTAANFVTKKKYNWGFSFDRRGDDVVMYQYTGEKWKYALEAASFRVGVGSYSDIRELDTLGCKFVNIGCGYDMEHTDYCLANLAQTTSQIAKFKEFYETFKSMRFTHVRSAEPYTWGRGSFSSYGSDYGKFSDDSGFAKNCGRYGSDYYDNTYWGERQAATGNVIAYCVNCKKRLLPSEMDDGVCGICLTYEDNFIENITHDGDHYFKDKTGFVTNAAGKDVCAHCFALLNETEDIICDDCWDIEYQKSKHTKEATDEDEG